MPVFYDENGREYDFITAPTSKLGEVKTTAQVGQEQDSIRQQQAMKAEADTMLAEQEQKMKTEQAVDTNKDLNPELIAKITSQEKSKGPSYLSAGASSMPNYSGRMIEGFSDAGPAVQDAMMQKQEFDKYGRKDIDLDADVDIFDAQGNMITNKRKTTLGETMMEAYDDFTYTGARAMVGGILMAEEFYGLDDENSKAIAARKYDRLNDQQMAELFINKPVYVRNNHTGKVEKKTYGDIMSDVEKGARDILKGLPEATIIAMLSLATGGLAGAAVTSGHYGSRTAGEEYGKLRKEGYSKADAWTASTAKAMVVAGTETVGTEAIKRIPGLNKVAGKVGRTMLGQSASEGATEGLEQYGTNAVDKYMLGKDVELGDGVLQNVVGGAVMGPTVGAATSLGRRVGLGKTNVSTSKPKAEAKVEQEAKVEPKVEEKVPTKEEIEAQEAKAKQDEIDNAWVDRLNEKDPNVDSQWNKVTNEWRRADGTTASEVETTTNSTGGTRFESTTTTPTVDNSGRISKILEEGGESLQKYIDLSGGLNGRGKKTRRRKIDPNIATDANIKAFAEIKNLQRESTTAYVSEAKVDKTPSTVETPSTTPTTTTSAQSNNIVDDATANRRLADLDSEDVDKTTAKSTEVKVEVEKDVNVDTKKATSVNIIELLRKTQEQKEVEKQRKIDNAWVDVYDPNNKTSVEYEHNKITGRRRVKGSEVDEDVEIETTPTLTSPTIPSTTKVVDDATAKARVAELDRKAVDKTTSTMKPEPASNTILSQDAIDNLVSEHKNAQSESRDAETNIEKLEELKEEAEKWNMSTKPEDTFSSDTFTITHNPTSNNAVIKVNESGATFFLNNVTREAYMEMRRKGEIGEEFNDSMRGKHKTLAPNRVVESMFPNDISKITKKQKGEIRYINDMVGQGRAVTNGKLKGAIVKQLDSMSKATVGKLIVAARTDSRYDAKTKAAISKYYDERTRLTPSKGSKSEAKDKDDDDNNTPTPPKANSEKELKDTLSELRKKVTGSNAGQFFRTANDLKGAMNSLVDITKSKYYSAKSSMGRMVRDTYAKLKALARKLGDEFADVANGFMFDTKNGLVLGVVQDEGGKTMDDFATTVKANDKREETVKNIDTGEEFDKPSKSVTYSKNLNDNIDKVHDILDNDEIVSKLYPKELGLLSSLPIVSEDNLNVNLRNLDESYDYETFNDNIVPVLDALDHANHNEITKALLEARADNKAKKDAALKGDIKKVFKETKRLRKTKLFSKMSVTFRGKKYKLPANPIFSAQHMAKLGGETIMDNTWKPIDKANRRQLYLENSFTNNYREHVANNAKDLKKVFSKYAEVPTKDIFSTPVYKFKGLSTQRKISDLKLSLETMLLLDNADLEGSTSGLYHMKVPHDDGIVSITLTEQQLREVGEYVDKVKSSNSEAIESFEDMMYDSFGNVTNANNAHGAISSISGTTKLRFIDEAIPVPFGKYENEYSDDTPINEQRDRLKSFNNRYDKTKVKPEDRVYHISTMSDHLLNYAKESSFIIAKENVIRKLSSFKSNAEIKDAMSEAYGASMYKNFNKWMDNQISDYYNVSNGVEGLPTGKIARILKDRINKSYLAYKSTVIGKQAPSAAISAPYIAEAWDENLAKVSARLVANVAISHGKKVKDLGHQVTSKLKHDDATKLRDRLWNMYDPQLISRMNSGANYEIRQIRKMTEGKVIDLGKGKSALDVIINSPNTFVEVGMKGITIEDNVIIDAIWNTNLHYGLKNAEGNINPAVSAYIKALNSPTGLSAKVISDMNKYLDTQIDGEVDVFKDVSDVNSEVVAYSQPGAEGHNIMNDKREVDAISQIRSFMSSARDAASSTIKYRNAELHVAIASGDKDDILKALIKSVQARLTLLVSAMGIMAVSKGYSSTVKPENEFYEGKTYMAKELFDIYMDTDIQHSLLNNAVSAFIGDGNKFGIANTDAPATLMLKEGLDVYEKISKKVRDGRVLTEEDTYDMINVGLQASYGINLDPFVDVIEAITDGDKLDIKDALSSVDRDDPIAVQDAKIEILNTLIARAMDNKDKSKADKYIRHRRRATSIRKKMVADSQK